MKLSGLPLATVLAGCANVPGDAHNIGTGSHLQLVDGETVVLEMNIRLAGIQSCVTIVDG